MNNINWYYPNSPAEASTLMLRGKTILHAGSTGLRGRDIPSGTSLLDLSKAGLSNCTIKPGAITLGAMCTYADVVKALQEKIPDHILVKSLKPAANTPLRNRITVGGSVAFFPPWSDLMGPLLALDATVVLAGKNEGEYPIAAFIEKKELREQSLITSIKIPAGEWLAAHHREIRSVSDMPAFTITLLLQKNEQFITACRIFIIGTANRFSHLTEVENYLTNCPVADIKPATVEKMVSLKFGGSRIADPKYASVKCGIELGRMIEKLTKEA